QGGIPGGSGRRRSSFDPAIIIVDQWLIESRPGVLTVVIRRLTAVKPNHAFILSWQDLLAGVAEGPGARDAPGPTLLFRPAFSAGRGFPPAGSPTAAAPAAGRAAPASASCSLP